MSPPAHVGGYALARSLESGDTKGWNPALRLVAQPPGLPT
jgi:hypothetical protein